MVNFQASFYIPFLLDIVFTWLLGYCSISVLFLPHGLPLLGLLYWLLLIPPTSHNGEEQAAGLRAFLFSTYIHSPGHFNQLHGFNMTYMLTDISTSAWTSALNSRLTQLTAYSVARLGHLNTHLTLKYNFGTWLLCCIITALAPSESRAPTIHTFCIPLPHWPGHVAHTAQPWNLLGPMGHHQRRCRSLISTCALGLTLLECCPETPVPWNAMWIERLSHPSWAQARPGGKCHSQLGLPQQNTIDGMA